MNGFKISPYLQEQATFISQMEVYGQASQSMEKLLRTKVSTSQVYRITDTYGELISQEVKEDFEVLQVAQDDVVYAQMDGSMIFTDDGWQEVKVGRLFRQSDLGKQSQNTERQRISKSQYVAHLGKHTDFLAVFNEALSPYGKLNKRLVFIADGALWIDKWIKSNYPQARSILDYYHLTQHLAKVGKLLIKQENKFQEWLSQNKAWLLDSQIDQVINAILRLKAEQPKQVDEKIKLMRYINKNRSRIDYKLYRSLGLQIGSGVIEATHRTLVQDRMKKSGQRWSDRGAQNMLNLRVAFKSQRWDMVIDKVLNIAC